MNSTIILQNSFDNMLKTCSFVMFIKMQLCKIQFIGDFTMLVVKLILRI